MLGTSYQTASASTPPLLLMPDGPRACDGRPCHVRPVPACLCAPECLACSYLHSSLCVRGYVNYYTSSRSQAPSPFSTIVGTRARSQANQGRASSITIAHGKAKISIPHAGAQASHGFPSFPQSHPRHLSRSESSRAPAPPQSPCTPAAVAPPRALRPRPPLAAPTRLPAFAPRITSTLQHVANTAPPSAIVAAAVAV